MQIREVLKQAVFQLRQSNLALADLDARVLLQHATNFTQETILLKGELELSPVIIELYQKLIDRRLKNEPVAKIIGKKPFWKAEFFVNQHTLDPRPDSEVIIESALKLFTNKDAPLRILDLGTGSGCLIISLLQEFPQAIGVASDISMDALAVAQQNASLLNVENRMILIQQNWADGLEEKFDLIISNPPYIPKSDILNLAFEVKEYDPMLALDGGEDGLDPYRYLAKHLAILLKPKACAILEFGYDQGEKVKEIFTNHNYNIEEMLYDLSGKQRAIRVSI